VSLLREPRLDGAATAISLLTALAFSTLAAIWPISALIASVGASPVSSSMRL
jgi:hypothetical protein